MIIAYCSRKSFADIVSIINGVTALLNYHRTYLETKLNSLKVNKSKILGAMLQPFATRKLYKHWGSISAWHFVQNEHSHFGVSIYIIIIDNQWYFTKVVSMEIKWQQISLIIQYFVLVVSLFFAMYFWGISHYFANFTKLGYEIFIGDFCFKNRQSKNTVNMNV